MIGRDAADAATTRKPREPRPSTTRDRSTPDALKGARIGVARKQIHGLQPGDRRAVRGGDRRDEGAGRRDRRSGGHSNRSAARRLRVRDPAVRVQGGSQRVSGSAAAIGPVHSLADLIAFNEREKAREMPYFGQEILMIGAEEGAADVSRISQGAGHVPSARRATLGIDAVLTKHRLDAIVAPTGGPAWTTDLVNGDHFVGASSTPAAVAGYPSVTVPAGDVHGLPVGLAFIGTAWSERQADRARITPTSRRRSSANRRRFCPLYGSEPEMR